MLKYFDRAFRTGLEETIRSQVAKQSPFAAKYPSMVKMPTFPKIVVYTSVSDHKQFLRKVFYDYEYLVPEPTAESDEVLVRRLAKTLLYPYNKTMNGMLIKGFPLNTNQALLLDRYIGGVNLAIYLKGETESSYEGTIQTLLDYYDERGTLLVCDHKPSLTQEDVDEVSKRVLLQIKHSQ